MLLFKHGIPFPASARHNYAFLLLLLLLLPSITADAQLLWSSSCYCGVLTALTVFQPKMAPPSNVAWSAVRTLPLHNVILAN